MEILQSQKALLISSMLPLAEVTGVALDATTAVNVLSITEADVYVNRGGFTVEDGTNSLNSVKVSKAGNYHIQ